MKSIVSILLAAMLALLAAGCGQTPVESSLPADEPDSSVSSPAVSAEEGITEEAVQALLSELMPKSDEISGFYRGVGLDAEIAEEDLPLPDENGQQFVPVTDSRFPSVADLVAYTETVYTEEYAQENFYQYALEGAYIRYKDIDGVLCIDLSQGGGGGYQWDTSTAAIFSQDGDTLTVSMDCVDYYDGKYEGTVTLKNMTEGWRIDALEAKDLVVG
ncbi:MAG: DL-endopeptidase inhibitor IseA family protein [Oscillospiraceae bacterium]|nr:DL-endopeptidase inhibitor IseA family protein [Oscillospiraceae bacterium]